MPPFFPSNQLELCPSLDYNFHDLSLSSMLKLLLWKPFSGVFNVFVNLKLEIIKCFHCKLSMGFLKAVLKIIKFDSKIEEMEKVPQL